MLGNAIKFTEEGYIHFGYQIKQSNVEFFVKDTGIGIDPEQKDKIFRPFGKINPSHVQNLYRGTGLGLSISKKLIELLGGEIWYDSELGKGTVFFFSLPFKTIQNNNTNLTHPNEVKYQNLKNITILVAEDEPDNFYLLSEILKPTEAKILWAKNGEEVISFLENNVNPHIILMDIKMPKLNGIEVFEIIRKKGNVMPVIAVTAHAYRNEQIEIIKHNFNGYIAKPINKNELLNLIYEILNNNK